MSSLNQRCIGAKLVWRTYWVLPVVSSLLLVIVTYSSPISESFLDELDTPYGQVQCTRPQKSNNGCGSRAERETYRKIKGGLWFMVFILEVVVLSLKCLHYRVRWFFMPLAQCTFQIARFIMAVSEVYCMTGPGTETQWVNPGLGLYGWTVSWERANGLLGTDNEFLVHVSLAFISALGFSYLSRRSDTTCDWQSELKAAVVTILAFWYPIYDVKHNCAGSRLSNLGFEFFLFFSLFNSIIEIAHEASSYQSESSIPDSEQIVGSWPAMQIESTQSASAAAKSFSTFLNHQQALLIVVSIGRFLMSMHSPGECWGAPITCVKEKSRIDVVWRFVIPVILNWGLMLGVFGWLFFMAAETPSGESKLAAESNSYVESKPNNTRTSAGIEMQKIESPAAKTSHVEPPLPVEATPEAEELEEPENLGQASAQESPAESVHEAPSHQALDEKRISLIPDSWNNCISEPGDIGP